MSHKKPARAKRLFSVLLAASVAFGGAAVAAPTTAHAAPGTVAAATFDWGVKDSFRKYLANPTQANGSATAIDNVAVDPDWKDAGKGFHWTGGTGTADTDGTAADVSFSGGVHMLGHDHGNGPALDIKFTNPRIEITSATTGKLYLDARSKKFEGMTVVSTQFYDVKGVHFADLTLPAANTATPDTLAYSGVTATLTAEGAEAFGGFYPAGQALEGLFSFTLPITVTPAAPAVKATETTLQLAKTAYEEGEDVGAAVKVVDADGATLTAANGSVELFVDNASVGTANFIAPASMFALTIKNLAVGDHNLHAVFTPADPAAYQTSTAAAQKITINAKAPVNPAPAPSHSPKIELFKEDGTTPLGDTEVYADDTIVIKGTDFNPNNVGGRGMPVPAHLGQGYYVAFGQFADVWQPSANQPKSSRPETSMVWAMTDASFDGVPANFKDAVQKQRIVLNADGSFTWTLKLSEITNGVAGGIPAIYAFPAGGIKDATYELRAAVKFVAGSRPATPVAPVAPVTPAPAPAPKVCMANEAVSGTLNWGLRESFRNYVQGSIAHGTFSGGSFSVAGGAVNAEAGIGVINFAGGIHAYGHNGVLDYKLHNPSVQITGANSGVLYATVNGSRVAFANLSFNGLQVTESAVTANWVSANLTAAGAQTFSYNGKAFYQAGEALDGFALNVKLGAKVPCDKVSGTDPKLAVTGGANMSAPLFAGSLALLMGAAVVVTARKRQRAAR